MVLGFFSGVRGRGEGGEEKRRVKAKRKSSRPTRHQRRITKARKNIGQVRSDCLLSCNNVFVQRRWPSVGDRAYVFPAPPASS